MKNDYLWDGQGSDPEIEKLETALSAFRYAETDPPELPADNIIVVGRQQPRGRFGFIYAFSAAVILLGFVGLTFRMMSSKSDNAAVRPIGTALPVSNEQIVNTAKSNPAPFVSSQSDKTSPALKTVKAVQITNRPKTNKPLLASTRAAKEPDVKLTTEEKYAYRQLMLALSITGSKLKQVHETIDRIEEKKNSDK